MTDPESLFADITRTANPQSLVDDVRRAIISRQLDPGAPLPLESLAKAFQVSPIPVREALKVLSGEALVEHAPYTGYRVARLSLAEFQRVDAMREWLEAELLRDAVAAAVPADDLEVSHAHARMSQMDEATERSLDGARTFHLALVAPARSPLRLRIYEMIWNVTALARPVTGLTPESQLLADREHDLLLQAFLSRDADLLVATAAEHFGHLTEILAFDHD